MSDAINRAVVAKARQILRIERVLVATSMIFTCVTLAASIYFEKAYGVEGYSFAFAIGGFLVSIACFWALFSIFRGGIEQRSTGKAGSRLVMTAASAYFVLASMVAYVVASGLFGLSVPWAGAGRENLYMCYFLLSVSVIFMARSIAFYWQLRTYILRSLANLVR